MIIPTPLGAMQAECDDRYLTSLQFYEGKYEMEEMLHPLGQQVKKELEEYFLGRREKFDIPIRPEGSNFQQKVWDQLLDLPYGKVMSYSDLAIRLGAVEHVRAVARANAENPILIIIPCHRVIGKDGGLTGYAGGLSRKRKLLQIEGIINEQKELF